MNMSYLEILLQKKLVNSGHIEVLDYNNFLNNNRRTYEDMFKNIYFSFNAKSFNNNDIYTYHHQKENLGEIRTALMAFYMNINLMMSDDYEAKQYVTNRLSSKRHPINVYNINDTLLLLAENKERSLQWKDIKGLAKRLFENNRYDNIRKQWTT